MFSGLRAFTLVLFCFAFSYRIRFVLFLFCCRVFVLFSCFVSLCWLFNRHLCCWTSALINTHWIELLISLLAGETAANSVWVPLRTPQILFITAKLLHWFWMTSRNNPFIIDIFCVFYVYGSVHHKSNYSKPTRFNCSQSILFYCRITLHVSGVFHTHHQEYIKL